MLKLEGTEVKERFKACKDLARRLGPEMVKKFTNVIKYLRTYGCFDGRVVRVRMFTDFAPYSFSLLWERRDKEGRWQPWFNGGLIYHGPHDNGGDGSFPTLSVNLTRHHGWSVHT